RSLKRFDVRSPIQRKQRSEHASIRIGRNDRQCSIVSSGFLGVAMLRPVSQSELLENEEVARVQLKSALQVARCLCPMAFATIDEACVTEYVGAVGQRLSGNSNLAAGPSIIAKTVVVIVGQGKVNFTRIRLEAPSGFQGGVGQVKTGCSVVMAPKVGNAMYSGQQTPSL